MGTALSPDRPIGVGPAAARTTTQPPAAARDLMEHLSDIAAEQVLDPGARDFYRDALTIMFEARIPFLVGGAYAFARYTGIERHTKDFDIFVRREDCLRALERFAERGYHTELTFPHWLGKAIHGDNFIDFIFGSGNGISAVDDEWFRHGLDDHVLGFAVRLCPVEEMLWQKSFIMERERFDGADVAHLLHARAEELDWHRLLRRFGEHWRVLLAHLVLFGFVYPRLRSRIPAWVVRELVGHLDDELSKEAEDDDRCGGPLLSRGQYLVDIDRRGYTDPRLEPIGRMTAAEIARWTAAITHRK